MDVLQEIFRNNGRSVNLLQHKKISVGKERGLYYVRAEHETGTREVVTVYLTEAEVDKLIEFRSRKAVEESSGRSAILDTIRDLAMIGRSRS